MAPSGHAVPPVALSRLFNVTGIPHAFTLALLTCAHVFGYALPLTVIPLLALDLLEDPQQVSQVLFVVGGCGLVGALTIPMITELIGRRRAGILGTVCILAAALLMAQGSVVTLIAGAGLYTFGYFAVDVSISVAVMERIPRRDLSRFETLRMAFIGMGFTLGPWLGITFQDLGGLWLPFAIMAACATGVCSYALATGLVTERIGLGFARANPLRYVPRYFAQPRLRLAWVLAAARSIWWNVFFVYGPIYWVQNGLSDSMAGLVVSLGTVPVIFSPLWGRLFRRIGLRGMLTVGFAATGLVTLAMSAATGSPLLAVGLLLLGTVTAAWIDAAGNALFLRAAKPLERAQMASVFSTFKDAGRIVPVGVFSVVLLALPLPAVFVITGVATLGVTYWTRFIPRRY